MLVIFRRARLAKLDKGVFVLVGAYSMMMWLIYIDESTSTPAMNRAFSIRPVPVMAILVFTPFVA